MTKQANQPKIKMGRLGFSKDYALDIEVHTLELYNLAATFNAYVKNAPASDPFRDITASMAYYLTEAVNAHGKKYPSGTGAISFEEGFLKVLLALCNAASKPNDGDYCPIMVFRERLNQAASVKRPDLYNEVQKFFTNTNGSSRDSETLPPDSVTAE